MMGCDKCGCFAGELRSLDGFTTLCATCENEVQHQHQQLLARTSQYGGVVQPIWDWLMQNTVPFRSVQTLRGEETVCYGGTDLLVVLEQMSDWRLVPGHEHPSDLLGFAKPSAEIDGSPTPVETHVYEAETYLFIVERSGCWVKLQFVNLSES